MATSHASIFRERSRTHLLEFGRWIVGPIVEDESRPLVERVSAAEMLLVQFQEIEGLLKLMLDARDTDGFIALDSGWSKIMEDPPYARRRLRTPADYVEQTPGRKSRVEQRPSDATRLSHLESSLDDYRALARLGLIGWTVHSMRATAEPDSQHVEAVKHLSSHFTSTDVVRLADLAFDPDWEERMGWSDWYAAELRDRIGYLPVHDELIRGVILVLLMQPAPSGTLALPPAEWMAGRSASIARDIDGFTAEGPRWSSLIDPEVLPGRARGLATSFEQAEQALEAARKRRLRAATASPRKIAEFVDGVHASWLEHRPLEALIEASRAYEHLDRRPAEIESRWMPIWLPKSIFVDEPAVGGLETIAEDVGRNLADGDVSLLVEALPRPTAHTPVGLLAVHARQLLHDLRANGFTPSLLLASNHWQILDELSVDVGRGRRGPGGRQRTLDGVPIVLSSGCPDECLWIVDLREAIRWIDWPAPQARDGLRIDLRFFDADSARAFVRERSVTYDSAPDETLDYLQEHARFEASPAFAVRLSDAQAVSGIQIEFDSDED